MTGLISQIQAIESLKQDGLSDDLQDQLILIERSAQRTARVANQFLSLARTNNTLADLSCATDFDLCELVRMTIADFLMLPDNADIQMMGEATIWMKGEPFTIELIVQNLIENAISHGGRAANSQIFVTCTTTASSVCIQVEDNGLGVPAAEFQSLTDRFFKRQPTSRNPDEVDCMILAQPFVTLRQGAGLGLSIVQEVVDAHGGDLAFSKSTKLGGLAVTVLLNRGKMGAGSSSNADENHFNKSRV